MPFRIEREFFDGEVKVIVPTKTFQDVRGWFGVPFRADEFKELGLPTEYVQDNHSFSVRGTIRGLHFQLVPPMGKLMRVTRGIAFLVAVDLRLGSPTFLRYASWIASDTNMAQIWAPADFARGFCAILDCEVQYKCTAMYNPASDGAIRWDDPQIDIDWPVSIHDPILSERDKAAPLAAEYFSFA